MSHEGDSSSSTLTLATVIQIDSKNFFSWSPDPSFSHSEEVLNNHFSAVLNYKEIEKQTDYFPFSSPGLLVYKDLKAPQQLQEGNCANYTKKMLTAGWKTSREYLAQILQGKS